MTKLRTGPRAERPSWLRIVLHVAGRVIRHRRSRAGASFARLGLLLLAALVFGARVDERGRPSWALHDRTVTGCRLYEAGLVSHLVLSGGRHPAVPHSEPEAMAGIALARGIPASALILDESGRNTLATLENAHRLMVERGWDEVLAVSHDLDLARVRLLAQRTGLPIRTVPARESVPWPKKYVFVTRELAAWTWWYVRSALPAWGTLSWGLDASTGHRRRLFAR